jgi:hypothetical protein
MGKVAFLLLDSGPQAAKVAMLMRTEFGIGMSALKESMSAKKPVFERPLFDRRDREFANKLASAMKQLDALGATYEAFELLQGQSYAPDLKLFQLTSEKIVNMITARAQSLEEQRSLGERQAGVD